MPSGAFDAVYLGVHSFYGWRRARIDQPDEYAADCPAEVGDDQQRVHQSHCAFKRVSARAASWGDGDDSTFERSWCGLARSRSNPTWMLAKRLSAASHPTPSPDTRCNHRLHHSPAIQAPGADARG